MRFFITTRIFFYLNVKFSSFDFARMIGKKYRKVCNDQVRFRVCDDKIGFRVCNDKIGFRVCNDKIGFRVCKDNQIVYRVEFL